MNRMPVAERREQLVAAALAVASREGIEGATVRAVAAEAGVSLGVVHYCFQDKDELLRAMAHAITVQNTTRVGEIPPGTPVEDALAIAIDSVWETIIANRGAQLLSYEVTTSSLRHSELGQVAVEQYRGSWAIAEQLFDAIGQISSVRWKMPTDELARIALALIDGYSLAWLVDGETEPAQRGLRGFARYVASLAEPIDPVEIPDELPVPADLPVAGE
ncbi:TetR/AcrR family transcriptional regulator [Cellulomonas sp. HZM]|uniref:TetR/AcrR family transcriptional regulator n=1 Tax=Cellulomonas sp. HZM TaxID=1454010 RepID=UPI00054EB73B|nr:TetR/AcrR family transcriptional regulator [Cellulomonas sp. HZM]